MTNNERLGAAVLSFLVGIGVGSLLDLLGRRTYENMQREMQHAARPHPEEAFAAATRIVEETRREMVPA